MARRRKHKGQAAKPKNFDDLLYQLDSFVDSFRDRNDLVWTTHSHGINTRTAQLLPEHFTEERAKFVKSVADKLRWLSDKANFLHRQFSAVHEMFLETLARQRSPLKMIDVKVDDSEPMWRPGQS